MGYTIRAEDGEIGRVKDVLVDPKTWAIRYLVVDTKHWWTGKTVLVSPGWFTRVTWDESKTLFCIVTTVGEAGPRDELIHPSQRTERHGRIVEGPAWEGRESRRDYAD
jgi:sporulation protein YlmC with PRC-barrel domain